MVKRLEKALLLTVAICTGCEGATDGAEGVGASEFMNAIHNSPPYADWALDGTSSLRIGVAMDGGDEHLFSNILHAARLSDGRVVVVDGGSLEVRWFFQDGTLDSRAGGRGSGPGEFGSIRSAAVLPGDTVVVFDTNNQRLTWFGPAGTLARTRRIELDSNLSVSLHPFEGERLLIVVESPQHNFGGREYNHARDSLFVILVSDEVNRADTILRMPGRESITWVDYFDGRPRGVRQMEFPFGHSTLAGGLENRIVVASTEDGGLTSFDTGGGAVDHALRTDIRPVLISAESRERYRRNTVERAVDVGVSEAVARGGAEGILSLLPEGRTSPAYDRLLIDRVGRRIWLRDFTPPWAKGDPRTWTIHDERGRVLARLTTPAGFDLLHVADGRITGMSRDSLGVEYVTDYTVVEARP